MKALLPDRQKSSNSDAGTDLEKKNLRLIIKNQQPSSLAKHFFQGKNFFINEPQGMSCTKLAQKQMKAN